MEKGFVMAGLKKWKRREVMLEYLKGKGVVFVEDLAKHFNISPSTIRRDLYVMEKEEMVHRSHGGVEINEYFTVLIPTFEDRLFCQVEEKKRIAKRICEEIEDNSTLALESGTTCFYIAQELKNRSGLTIVTSSIKIANVLSSTERNNVIITGGEYRLRNYDCLGTAPINTFLNMRFDYAIVTPDLIAPEMNSAYHISGQYADIVISMQKSADKILLAADKTKFDKKASFKSVDLSRVYTVFVDREVEKDHLSSLVEKNKVVIC